MPPESSEGQRFSTSSPRSTTFSFSTTRERIVSASGRSWRRFSVSGKATLSNTVIESKSAAPWKTIPKSCRASVSAFPSRAEISCPPTITEPRSGLKRPMTCFMSTVLPEPEPPRTT